MIQTAGTARFAAVIGLNSMNVLSEDVFAKETKDPDGILQNLKGIFANAFKILEVNKNGQGVYHRG